MAYKFDSYDQSLVIDGWENGIADSPYLGISNIRNANTVSIPGEVSVGFSTTSVTPPVLSGISVTSSDAAADTITYSSSVNAVNGQAIKFSATTIGGVSTNTLYWLSPQTSTTAKLYSDFAMVNLVDISSNGTGTFATTNMGQPKYFTYDNRNDTYYAIDANGLVWKNGTYWVYTGNTTLTNASGNGLAFYSASNGTGFVFAFRNSAIDYLPTSGTQTWVYGWNPADGTVANVTGYMKTASGTANSHEAQTMPNNELVYCDSNWIGRFYETNSSVPFVPTDVTTYTFDQFGNLLPSTDTAQCLAWLGTNVLIGGKRNVIYPWDTVSPKASYPILIAEHNVVKMITVNTNTFALVGNRGRIYVTNGTNANLYKKVPDHLSGTVEPYFTWGGVATQKNQLYFGVKAATNAGVDIPQYGGVWAIDMDTKALRQTHQLSYATYAGYATCIIQIATGNAAGTGMFIGWDDGNSGYGIDNTSSNPYSAGQTTIDSDLIPIGTFEKPRDLTKVEYRLAKAMVSGESIAIKTRLIFNTTDTGYTTTLTDSAAGNYSNLGDINFRNAQWVQFQIVLTSTNSSPSYVRLREIRIKGLVGPTLATSQQLTI